MENWKKVMIGGLFAVPLMAGAGNLVMNGEFKAPKGGFPNFWMFADNYGCKMEYHPDGGPDNKPFMRLGSTQDTVMLKQTNLTLIRGEKYRVSAYFRTKNVKNRQSGIWIGTGPHARFGTDNRGALPGENCLFGLPENLTEWRKYEKIITMDAAPEKQNYEFYTFDIVLASGGGELDIADVKLEGVSIRAISLSKSMMDSVEPHLVPVSPLSELSQNKPEIDFSWAGTFPGDPAAAEVEISFDVNGKRKKVPFSLERFTVDLQGVIPEGESVMTVRIFYRGSGKLVSEETFPVRTIRIPEVKNARQLNNMTVELCSMTVEPGKEFVAANPRYGFLLFRFKPEKKDGKFNVFLDGKKLFDQTFLRNEVLRQLDAGTYKVKADVKGTLTIRLIPDVVNFGGPSHAYAPGNGYYNWSFQKKYVTGGLTTFTTGNFSPAQFAELRKLGLVLLEDQGIHDFSQPMTHEVELKLLENSKIPFKQNCGMTLDEVECFYPRLLDPFAWAIRKFRNPTGKTIMTYMTGPVTPSNVNALSAAANASGKQGYLAFEYYVRGHRDMESAKQTIEQLRLHQVLLKQVAPALYPKAGVLLGNFSLYPRITLSHYPHTDYKYFLDMQLNAVANDPAYTGVGKVGFWGTYACDEEMVRWSFALMRHYVYEGRKDMLSDKYGFKLIPGFLTNVDFHDGLKGWQVSGDIIAGKYPQYGKLAMGLYGAKSGVGDDFAVFRRHEGKANTLTQTAKGLTKGKVYCLYFHTSDLDDVVACDPKVKRVPVAVKLTNAEILQKTHFNGPPKKGNAVISNMEKIIFRATAENVTLTFSDEKAAPGAQNTLTYIALRPYFEKEEMK